MTTTPPLAPLFYSNVNDAALATGNARYAKGEVEIWYAKPEHGRDLRMGLEFLQKHNLRVPCGLDTLNETHIKLGSIAAWDAEDAFYLMQGENWSPEGQARSLIQALGLRHTSMSVGDCVVFAGRLFFCDSVGFVALG